MKPIRLYPFQNEYHTKLEKLIKSFKTRMNGDAAAQMSDRGMNYARNFGISIPHIKEMITNLQFTPSELEKLWHTEYRETMLIACMLLPEKEITLNRIMDWSKSITHADIAEQASFYLFSRAPRPDELILFLIAQESPYAKASAFLTAGRVTQTNHQLHNQTILKLLEVIQPALQSSEKIVATGISVFLRQCWRRKTTMPMEWQNIINQLSAIKSTYSESILEELKTEIDCFPI